MRMALDTDQLPERDRIPFWHDTICREIFHVTPAEPIDDRFRAKLDIQTVGRFTMVELQSSHGSIEKSASNLSRSSDDSVMLYLAAETSHHSRSNAYEFRMSRGDVCIVPMAQRFNCDAGGVAFRSLLIPQAVLSPLMAGGELNQACLLPAGAPLGTLLRDSLEAVAAQLPHLPEAMADAVLGNLSGLVALACGASGEGRDTGRAALRAERLRAAKRHIGRHMANPLLDPAAVAAALGMSTRQLHLLFETSGDTFARYLLRRRLEACRETLSGPNAIGRSVADVAFGWGFNSLSVFYRAFGAAFDMSPSSARASAVSRQTASSDLVLNLRKPDPQGNCDQAESAAHRAPD